MGKTYWKNLSGLSRADRLCASSTDLTHVKNAVRKIQAPKSGFTTQITGFNILFLKNINQGDLFVLKIGRKPEQIDTSRRYKLI